MNDDSETRKIWTLIVSSFVLCVLAVLSLLTCGLSAIMAAMGLGFGLYALSLIRDLDGSRSQRISAWIGTILNGIFGLLLILGILIGGFWPIPPIAKKADKCVTNLHQLSVVIHAYERDNNGKYPAPEIWCDLLNKSYSGLEQNFICPSALRKGDSGPSHYAMNPHCEPNSPADTILLFETKGGWNQQGGPEILSTEHFDPGCNILFNNFSVRSIKTEELGTLRWKPYDANQPQLKE